MSSATQEKAVGDFCSQCGAKTDLQSRVDEAIGRNMGEVRDRTKMEDRYINITFGLGMASFLARGCAAFIAANTLVPEQYKVIANIIAGLYTIGIGCSGLARLSMSDADNVLAWDIKDRVKAYTTDSDEGA